MVSDRTTIGAGITVTGLFFTWFGVVLFLDRGLMALGNVLTLAGVVFILGPSRTYSVFAAQPIGAAVFVLGFGVLLTGWAVVGLVVEVAGFVSVFWNFFPAVYSFISMLPVVGPWVPKWGSKRKSY